MCWLLCCPFQLPPQLPTRRRRQQQQQGREGLSLHEGARTPTMFFLRILKEVQTQYHLLMMMILYTPNILWKKFYCGISTCAFSVSYYYSCTHTCQRGDSIALVLLAETEMSLVAQSPKMVFSSFYTPLYYWNRWVVRHAPTLLLFYIYMGSLLQVVGESKKP